MPTLQTLRFVFVFEILDCSELPYNSPSGVYEISMDDPTNPGTLKVVPVYCDMTTNGGGMDGILL
jgi:hypothetical protein